MDDILNKNQSAGEQPTEAAQTRVMQPVEAEAKSAASRRRRTERNQETYDPANDVPVAEEDETTTPIQTPPRFTVSKPVQQPVAPVNLGVKKLNVERQQPAQEGNGTTVVPRFQTRYNPQVPGAAPSQGVPRPVSLNVQAARRPTLTPNTGEVRRPVQAEGYTPVKPLGAARPAAGAQNAAEKRPVRTNADEARRRDATPKLDDGDEYVAQGGGRGLVIAIIALLTVAALVLGMLMIPADMEGPLGDMKRAVSGVFGGQKQEKVPAVAQGLLASVSKDTIPYAISFNVTTTQAVENVRIVNEAGEVMHTTILTTTQMSETSKVWVLQMLLAIEYEGTVRVQIHDGESWIDTDYQQMLNVSDDLKLTISDVPADEMTAVTTVAATGIDAQTADSVTEPTVFPAVTDSAEPEMTEIPTEVPVTDAPVVITDEPTEEPTDAPTATPEAEPTEAPTEEPTEAPTATPTMVPTEEPTATPVVTATPTMSVTATPTVHITAEPTPEPTATPTAEPTPEPTPEPTATPVPTAVPTAKLEAAAAEGADPSLVAVEKVYVGTKRTDDYERAAVINMPAGDDYLTKPVGVVTFRGNAFRMNGAIGTVTEPTAMSPLWSVEAGSLVAKSRTFYGFGPYAQPVIVKWTKEIREAMNLNEGYAEQVLKEVIIAGQDGKIYFLDLKDGSATREAINLGYAMRSTPSLHPLGFPLMTVGQYSNKLPNKTGKTMGLYYYDLTNSEPLRLIDGLDGGNDRQYYHVGAFDTSALFDRNSNTLIAIGTNGMLYTEKLDMRFIANNGGIFEFDDVKEQAILMSHTKKQATDDASVESSMAMYGSYVFYADMGGVLRCVDTTTMKTVWAVETGDAVRAAVALDLEEETNILWLYTANTITNRTRKTSDVTIRRFNAMTGEEDWSFAVNSVKKSGKKDSYAKDVTAGAVASPVIGQHGLCDLVYFTLSSVSAEGAAKVNGTDSAIPSVLMAMNKATGEIVWSLSMDAYSYSSPVAVYDEQGRGWIIQGCSNGTLYLLDGLTGTVINTLQVEGIIEGSPAVYSDTIVFGTTGKGKSYIHAVKLQ